MKLSRDLSLFSVTMIGVGAMIGAGIFVLTGIAAGIAGPAVILAFLLNGIVAFFTASAYAELGGSIPEAGGGYLWVKNTLPQPSGFLAGWMSWMAHSVACSLYATGFGAYFGEVLYEFGFNLPIHPEILKRTLAVFIVLIFSYINYKGAKETGRAGNVVTVLKVIILLFFVLLGLRIIFSEPVRFEHFKPFFSKGFGGILTAMGLTYIAFEGYEIIAQSGEEVKNPEKNIPRAIFLSLLIVIPIYIFVAFVALGIVNPEANLKAWDILAQKKEIALVEAARGISVIGGIVILIGGLLSTISALNATIYSSSRVSFAMGRDYNLPEIFSRIHKKYRTPDGSIFISTVLIILMVILLPIEDIASSADVMFLYLFIFVNISLIHIRRKKPHNLKGYKSPFFPLFPVIAILTQAVLIIVMFIYSPKSFFLSLLWVGAGVAIYYAYSVKREKEEVGPKVLIEEKELVHKDFKINVAIKKENEIKSLMKIAIDIAKEKDGEIFLTHIIPLPPQTPLHAGKRLVEGRRKMLENAEKIGEKDEIPVSFSIRISHNVWQGILDSTHENKTNLLILGAGEIKIRGRLFGNIIEPLLQEAPSDICVLKIKNDVKRYRKILVPTAGGPNAKLAFEISTWIANQNKGKVTLMYIIKDKAEEEKAKFWLSKTKEGVKFRKKILNEKIVEGKNILNTLLKQSENYDLVIIGASRENLWRRIRFGTIPEKLLRKSRKPVMVVRKYEGKVLSWIRRFIAG